MKTNRQKAYYHRRSIIKNKYFDKDVIEFGEALKKQGMSE